MFPSRILVDFSFFKLSAFKSCSFWLWNPWIHLPCLWSSNFRMPKNHPRSLKRFWFLALLLRASESEDLGEAPRNQHFWLTQGLQFEEYFSTLDCPQKGSTSEKRELCASLTHSETFYKLGEEMIPRPIFLKIWADFAFCSLYEDQNTLFPCHFLWDYDIFFFFLPKIITSNKK